MHIKKKGQYCLKVSTKIVFALKSLLVLVVSLLSHPPVYLHSLSLPGYLAQTSQLDIKYNNIFPPEVILNKNSVNIQTATARGASQLVYLNPA